MPSSTSSSRVPGFPKIERPLPTLHLGAPAFWALLLCVFASVGWELYVRNLGYRPSINDSADSWAYWRGQAVRGDGKAVVIIGASRAAYDIDLEVAKDKLGHRPIQLATVGSNPSPILWDLADDPDFRGIVICGVTPGLFFAPAPSPPFQNALRAIQRYQSWSPSQRLGWYLASGLQLYVAFLNPEDLSLDKLLSGLNLPDRSGAQVPRTPPPQFGEMDHFRQLRLTSKTESDPAFQELMKKRWYALEQPPEKPPIFSDEQWARIGEVARNQLLERTAEAVTAIQARGGNVVFVRLPSTGRYRELERELYPRESGWDRILAQTGAPGIHFEDHEALMNFQCPEESHLGPADAAEFTRRLIPLVQAKLKSPG